MSEWILVDDRLPSEGVVVAIHGGDIERLGLKTTAGYYNSLYLCFEAILEGGEIELCHAALWQPLPEPPKVKHAP